MAKKRAVKSKRRTSARSSASKARPTKARKKSSNTSLSAGQKRLKENQNPPWERIEALGLSNPTIYTIPWELRGLSSALGAKNLSGLGYVGEYKEMGRDFISPTYSWAIFCQKRARKDTSTPFPEGLHEDMYTLRDDQEEDMNMVLAAHRAGAPEFFIGNGTGVGKTVTTWRTIQELSPKSVLIVCPEPVIEVWRQHIESMGDRGIDIVIINYESIKKMVKPSARAVNAKTTKTQNKYIALDGVPYIDFEMVVFDESHKLAEPTSQRSRVCATFADRADFIIRLTATPGKDPSKLHYLWRGLSWSTGNPVSVSSDEDFSSYAAWCRKNGIKGIKTAPFGNGIVWEGEEKELDVMSDIIYGSDTKWAIKRVPEKWGPTVRQPLPIPMSSEDRTSYEATVAEARKAVLDGSSARGKDMTKGIAAIVAMRQKSGMIKAAPAVEYAKYCVKDLGEQVVLATVFHAVTDVVTSELDKAGLTYVVVTGECTAAEKESNRKSFQKGEVDVIVTSITTGISLHANEGSTSATSNPRRMIVVDAQWSPTEHKQLEGRINRNGETGIITMPMLKNSVDEKVLTTLLKGVGNMASIQGSEQDRNDVEVLADAMDIKL